MGVKTNSRVFKNFNFIFEKILSRFSPLKKKRSFDIFIPP